MHPPHHHHHHHLSNWILSGEDTADSSSGHIPLRKEVAPPPPRRPVPPHRLSPPQVGHDSSPLRFRPSVCSPRPFYRDVSPALPQVAVHGSARRMSPDPLTLMTLLLLLLTSREQRWAGRLWAMIAATAERQKIKNKQRQGQGRSSWCEESFCTYRSATLMFLFIVYCCQEVHSLYSYVTCTYLCILLFICI